MQPPFFEARLPTRDAWNRDKVVNDLSLISGLFSFGVPVTHWRFFENGTRVTTSANITSTDGMLDISSNSNKVSMATRRHLTYQPNRGLIYSASMILPDISKDANQRFGVDNDNAGLFFKARNGNLYAVRRTLNTDYEELIKLPNGVDLTKGCLFDIQAQIRGVGDIAFMVTHQKGTTVHVMNLLGTLTGLSVSNPSFSAYFEVEYVTEDATMYCGCFDYSSEGGAKNSQTYQSASASVNVTAGAGVGQVFAIRQPLQISGKTNTIDIELARIRLTADKKATYKFYIFDDETAITATWTAVGNGSYVEKADSSAISSYDVSKMREITTIEVPAADIQQIVDNPNPTKIDFYMIHGDYAFVEITSGVGALTKITYEWGEET